VRDQLRDEVAGHLREAVAAARLAALSNTEVVGLLREMLKEEDDG
jgi:hypothetical protein